MTSVPPNWEPHDVHGANSAESFHQLRLVAETVIRRLVTSPTKSPASPGLMIVSGPITTGNDQTVEENMADIALAISLLVKQDHEVFDQLPFEPRLEYLAREWHDEHGTANYCEPIITEFYKPLLIDPKMIHMLVQLPGWKNSTGARMEWEIFTGVKGYGVRPVYELPANWKTELVLE